MANKKKPITNLDYVIGRFIVAKITKVVGKLLGGSQPIVKQTVQRRTNIMVRWKVDISLKKFELYKTMTTIKKPDPGSSF